MEQSKFSESQIVAILKEGDAGVPEVLNLCVFESLEQVKLLTDDPHDSLDRVLPLAFYAEK